MVNLLRSLLSDSFIYAVLPRLSRLLSIAIMPVITKYLTPYDYGVTGILLAYIHIFEGFRNLGMEVVLINAFFKQAEQYKEIWAKIFGFLSLWALPYGALLIPFTYFALPEQEKARLLYVAVVVISPIIFFDHTIDLGQKYLQMNRKSVIFSIISLSASIIVLLANYLTIVQLRMGYMGFLLSDSIGKIFSFISYSFLLFHRVKLFPSFSFSRIWLSEQLRIALPTIPHAYAAYLLNTSDRLLLNLFNVSVGSIGLYSFAYSFATNFSKIGSSMLVAGRPIIMKLYASETKEADTQVRNLIWILQAGLLSGGFILSLWIKEIIQVLSSNPSLDTAYVYAPLLIMAYTYYPLYFGAINKLYYYEKTRIFWKISFLAALINVGLNLVLIPQIGVWGATIATLFSYLFMGFSVFSTKEFKQINSIKFKEIYWLFLTCLLTVSTFILIDAPPIIKVILTFGLFILWSIGYYLYRQGWISFLTPTQELS